MNKKILNLALAITIQSSAMQLPPAPKDPNESLGWFGWIPFLPQTDKAIKEGITFKFPATDQALEKLGTSMEISSLNFKTAVDHNSRVIDQGFKIAPQSIKTFFIAGLGAALATAGIVLFIRNLRKETTDKEDQTLWQKIATPISAISAALFALGVTTILKSDTVANHF